MDQVNTRDLRNSLKGKGEKRQVILSGRKGKTYSDFIEKETDNTIKIIASEQEPLVVSLADGFGELGQVDYTKKFTQDFTGVPVESNATNFVLLEKDDNDLYSLKTTKQQPIYGSLLTSDRENKICASFNAPSGSKTFSDPYGNFFRFYGGSEITNSYQIFNRNTAYFNGAMGSYAICETPSLNTSDLDQWTLEFNVKFNTLGVYQVLVDGGALIGGGNNPIHVLLHNDNRMRIYLGDGSGTWILSDGLIVHPLTGTFGTILPYQIVIEFKKTTVRVYVDGALAALFNTFVNTWNYKTPHFQNFVLGHRGDYTNYPFNGYISDFQFWPYAKYSNLPSSRTRTINAPVFSNGVNTQECVPDTIVPDRYIKNNKTIYFDFELPQGSTDITDYYGNKLITSWSGSDVIREPSVSSFYPAKFGTKCLIRLGSVYSANRAQVKVDLDTSKWTIEFWHYYDDGTGLYTILFTDADYSISISKGATNELIVLLGNGGSWITTMTSSAGVLNFGDWNHIALTYDGIRYRMFCNGVLEGTYTPTTAFEVYKPSHLTLGHPFTDVNCLQDSAYDDFAVHNYCKYTASFTPPTEPLSNSIEPMYYYDIARAEMYKGFYGSLAKQPAIFLGEVDTVGNEITDVVSYSVGGKTGPIELRGTPNENFANTTYFKHNIGDINLNIDIDFIMGRTYGGFLPGERIKNVQVYSSQYTTNGLSILTRNLFSHTMGNGGPYLIFRKSDGIADHGAFTTTYTGLGYIEFNVERSW
jgi:hypothetical protein